MGKIDKDKLEKVDNTDYSVFFYIGIIFLAIGVILTLTVSTAFLGFMVFGLIFLVTGIVNKDKWYGKND